MKVAVVLVNWRRPTLTARCLDSLASLDRGHELDVIVVDNASGDGSIALLQTGYPHVTTLANATNAGFTGGCNTGIRTALERGADLVWLLNNDAEVVPDALSHLLDAVARHPGADFFGSWVVQRSDPQVLWFAGGNFDRRTGRAAHVGYGERVDEQSAAATPFTDWLTGCSLVVRSEVLHRTGLLDDALFLYKEELDLQLRVAAARPDRGREMTVLVPLPLVHHEVGATTGTTSSKLGHAYMARNGLRLMCRHAGTAAPRWALFWLREFVVVPALRRRADLLRATWLGVRHVASPGPALLAALELAATLKTPAVGAKDAGTATFTQN